ncbi:hypothetical protein [Nocardiopsis sp. LOL_012]|uniref:hypothetical protein n=1 Tax=Nocardiopsis sp. LOL_012 TaxID=3345409 RepID=UPI003A885834
MTRRPRARRRPEEEDAHDRPLTAEEERAVARQGETIRRELEWEARLRARGERLPGPFERAEWGDRG